MILSNPTDAIRVILDEATTTNEVEVIASWTDVDTTQIPPVYLPDSNQGLVALTTAFELVGGPTSPLRRSILGVTAFNADTVAAGVRIVKTVSSVDYTLWYGVLAEGESVCYVHNEGWTRRTAAGDPVRSNLSAADEILAKVESLQAAILYFATAVLDKLPRVDANDRLIATLAEVAPNVGTVTTVSGVTTLTTLTNATNLNNLAGGNTAAIPFQMSNAGAMHIYNNLLVS